MKPALIVGTSCVAVLATIALYALSRNADAKASTPSAELADRGNALQSMETRLEKLERSERASLASALNALKQAPQPALAAEADPPSLDEETTAAAVEEQPLRDNQAFRHYFEQEGRDPAWATPTEALVVAAFSDERFDATTLRSVRCGTNICRLDSEHANTEAVDGFVREFATSIAEEFAAGSIEKHTKDDGTFETTVYVVRRGVGYPQNWAEEEGLVEN